MQKKKILFVMESLRIGGAEKSLLTILSMFDYDKYDVDLFLFRQNGELMSFLSNNINLLQEDSLFKCFDEMVSRVGQFSKIYLICFKYY